LLSNPNAADGTSAVQAFNDIYGEMDSALWCLSRHCRADLVAGMSSPRVEALVWTVKSWWGVQGVRTETRAQMAQALAGMKWKKHDFDTPAANGQHPAAVADSLVSALVSDTIKLGGARREFSLASKVLHWLAPWRVPVYDSFVRQQVGVPTSWDHPEAYRAVARGLFDLVRKCDGWSDEWLGSIGPRAPLRALDKYLWWSAGGSQGTSALVKRPNDVLYRLGIDPSDGAE
jgi:hypothetical protein